MTSPSNIGASRRRPLIWAAVGIAVAAIVLAVAAYFVVGPGRPGGPPGSVLVQLSGTGNLESKRFYARRGWEIDWENSGAYFSFTIHGDTEFGQVITQNGPGNGITTPIPTGNFFIEVVAQGPWSIKVLQGE